MTSREKKKLVPDFSVAELRQRLDELEQTLDAIRSGQIDALVDYHGNIFTLQGADTAYRIMVDTMNEGAMTLDADGLVLYANASLCSILGVSLSGITGRPVRDFIPPDTVAAFEKFLATCIQGKAAHREFVFLTAKGIPVPVHLSGAPFERGTRTAACFVAYDLSERVAVERKLLQLNIDLEHKVTERTAELQSLNANLEDLVTRRTQQVHDLSKALTIAEQKERLRFSQILHDDLQQILFSAKIQLDILRSELPALAAESTDGFIRLGKLIGKGIHASRSLALELNPPVLRNEGLDVALQWLAQHMEEHYAMTITVDIPPDTARVREHDRILITQLARELLFNVVKHARARKVVITGHKLNGNLEVAIEDNGIGFNVEEVRGRDIHRYGMGLFSIEERLHLFGGSLDIKSRPGQGTRAAIIMPVSE